MTLAGMKPRKCCQNCEQLDEHGNFKNKFKCSFCEKYALEQIMQLHNEQKVERGCSTCKNCKHIYDFPGYITAEECICTAGLQCDTVLFSVKNCPKWVDQFESEGADAVSD